MQSLREYKSGVLTVYCDSMTSIIRRFTVGGPQEDYLVSRVRPGHPLFYGRYYYVRLRQRHKTLLILSLTQRDFKRMTEYYTR